MMREKLLNKKFILSLLIIVLVFVAIYQWIRPKHNIFIKIGNLNINRVQHTATLLNEDRVLVTGGFPGLDSAEIYSPKTNKFNLIENMTTGRYSHTATLLSDGRVLITGGMSQKIERKGKMLLFKNKNISNTAEIFDPNTNKFSAVSNMNIPRQYHTATLLPNGKVVIIGGSTGNGFALEIEEFNPNSNNFTIVGRLKRPHSLHNSVLLPNNNILIVGEPRNNDDEYFAQIYNTERKQITELINIKNRHSLGTLTRLNNENILITGGSGSRGQENIDSSMIYKLRTNKFIDASNLNTGRSNHTATLLPNGQVLIVGGTTGRNIFLKDLSSAEVFDFRSNNFEAITSTLASRRSGHTAIPLKNGNVLILGGGNRKDLVATAELYLY